MITFTHICNRKKIMNVKINKHIIKYIQNNNDAYKDITINENDLWHLNKIIQKLPTEKEKNFFELEKDNITVQIPMRLFNLTKDIIPEY